MTDDDNTLITLIEAVETINLKIAEFTKIKNEETSDRWWDIYNHRIEGLEIALKIIKGEDWPEVGEPNATEAVLVEDALTVAGTIVGAAERLGWGKETLKRAIIRNRIEWPRKRQAAP